MYPSARVNRKLSEFSAKILHYCFLNRSSSLKWYQSLRVDSISQRRLNRKLLLLEKPYESLYDLRRVTDRF